MLLGEGTKGDYGYRNLLVQPKNCENFGRFKI